MGNQKSTGKLKKKANKNKTKQNHNKTKQTKRKQKSKEIPPWKGLRKLQYKN